MNCCYTNKTSSPAIQSPNKGQQTPVHLHSSSTSLSHSPTALSLPLIRAVKVPFRGVDFSVFSIIPVLSGFLTTSSSLLTLLLSSFDTLCSELHCVLGGLGGADWKARVGTRAVSSVVEVCPLACVAKQKGCVCRSRVGWGGPLNRVIVLMWLEVQFDCC